MKKFLLICFTLSAFIAKPYAQLEHWTNLTSSIVAEKETTEKTEGSFSLKATWTSTSNQDIESAEFNVTAGASFTYKLDVLDNTNAGRVRMVIIWSTGNDYQNIYSEDNTNWQTLEYAGTVPDGATTAKVRLRFYDESAGWAGNGNSATLYIDNASYIEGTGSNQITDGGFELWSAVGTLELTTPNGSESYDAGQQVQLAWNSTGVSNVFFEVWTNENTWEKITDNIASVDGANTHDYTIPLNAWTWDGYKVRIVDADNTSLNDESDAVFSINGHDVEIFWEDFSDGTLGSFDEVSVSGTNTWYADENSGKTFAKMSGYNNGINEDWLISSAINLDNSTDEILEFQTACNYSGDDIVVKYSIDYDGQGDPSTATWTEFPAYTLSAGSWAWTHSGYIDLGSITGSIHVAFIFTCSETASKTWEVTDIYVSGINDSSTSVDSQKASEVIISPNPFSNELYIKGTKELQNIILFNTAGQVVMNNQSGSKRVSTANLPKGMYIVQVKFMDGTSTTQKVIKK